MWSSFLEERAETSAERVWVDLFGSHPPVALGVVSFPVVGLVLVSVGVVTVPSIMNCGASSS